MSNGEKTSITVNVVSENYDNPGTYDDTTVSWSNGSPTIDANTLIETFAGLMISLTYQPGSIIRAMETFTDEHQSWKFKEDESPGSFE